MISSDALPGKAVQVFSLTKRFQKFIVVGIIGLAVNQVMLVILHDAFSLTLALASVVAIAISMIVTFLLNEVWTWHDRGTGMVYHRLAKYIPINTVGLAINTGVLLLLVNQFGMHKLLANLIGAGLYGGLEFFHERRDHLARVKFTIVFTAMSRSYFHSWKVPDAGWYTKPSVTAGVR